RRLQSGKRTGRMPNEVPAAADAPVKCGSGMRERGPATAVTVVADTRAYPGAVESIGAARCDDAGLSDRLRGHGRRRRRRGGRDAETDENSLVGTRLHGSDARARWAGVPATSLPRQQRATVLPLSLDVGATP